MTNREQREQHSFYASQIGGISHHLVFPESNKPEPIEYGAYRAYYYHLMHEATREEYLSHECERLVYWCGYQHAFNRLISESFDTIAQYRTDKEIFNA